MTEQKKVTISSENYEMLKAVAQREHLSVKCLLNKLIENFMNKGMTVTIHSSDVKKSIFDKYTDRDNATS